MSIEKTKGVPRLTIKAVSEKNRLIHFQMNYLWRNFQSKYWITSQRNYQSNVSKGWSMKTWLMKHADKNHKKSFENPEILGIEIPEEIFERSSKELQEFFKILLKNSLIHC